MAFKKRIDEQKDVLQPLGHIDGMFGLQVNSDWRMHGTPEILSDQLLDFKFSGPGFYLTKESTILVIRENVREAAQRSPWDKEVHDGDTYTVHVYSCPFNATIFSQVAIAPVRQDDREL